MVHILVSSFIFFFSVLPNLPKEKISLAIESNKVNLTIDSSELVITSAIKNSDDKTYYISQGNRFSTCNSLGFYWLVDVQFNDSVKLYNNCVFPYFTPLSKRMSFKLKGGSEKFVTLKVDLKNLVSQEDYRQDIKYNTHFGRYSVTVSYCDRDRLNNKPQSDVFTSNKIYFTYQK